MSDDDIIRWAREAAGGMLSYDSEGEFRLSAAEIKRFAASVAAAEREACAKLCEERADEAIDDYDADGMHACAEAIRTRGQK